MIRRSLLALTFSLLVVGMVAAFDTTGVAVPSASAQEVDQQVPPGNPVIGSDRPGDTEPESGVARYGLWGVVGLCLLGAGILLVKLERWEASRTPASV